MLEMINFERLQNNPIDLVKFIYDLKGGCAEQSQWVNIIEIHRGRVPEGQLVRYELKPVLPGAEEFEFVLVDNKTNTIIKEDRPVSGDAVALTAWCIAPSGRIPTHGHICIDVILYVGQHSSLLLSHQLTISYEIATTQLPLLHLSASASS